MEALTADVRAVVSGMEEADKELIATGPGAPQRLINFVREQAPRVAELQTKAETARNMFAQTTEWFGEALNKPSPETFFTCITKFIQQFKVKQLLVLQLIRSLLKSFEYHVICNLTAVFSKN